MRHLRLTALLLGLAACDPAPPPEVPARDADSCGARGHAGLVGRDATALERVLILGPVQVIRPGMAVTMDHRPDRINFTISEAGRIARIRCG
jgi:hypothetical protein